MVRVVRVRVGVRVGVRVRGRSRGRSRSRSRGSYRGRGRGRGRFAFCSSDFSFTEYIHAASFSMWSERE